MEKSFFINGQEYKVQNYHVSGEMVSFELNGKKYEYHLISKDGASMILDSGGRFRASVSSPSKEGECMVVADGREARSMIGGRKLKKAGALGGSLISPMPGKIFKVIKEAGAEVKKGETILILEAMKMEHSIRSDKDGKVKKVNYRVGELVQGGVSLAEVE
jgi:biotin carboxyl carrier protein